MHQISFKIGVLEIILFHDVFYLLRYIASRTFCFSSRKRWKWNVWSFFGIRGYSGEQTRGRITVRNFRRQMRLTSAEPQLFRLFWVILLCAWFIGIRNMRGMHQNP